FYEQERNIPPCRRRIGPVVQANACQVNDRVTPVNNTTYAVGSSNRAFHPVNGRIACGSMVLFLSFAQKNSLSEFFCAKDLVSFALPETKCSAGSVTA
ncbi:MAG: hypothetical protein ACLFVO_21045, partial [Chloroflexaceae bacterium]